jgi:hypothetical protein
MYVITINKDQTFYFEKFQDIVPYVKQEIRKHTRNNDSSYIASYDEWFFTDNHTIYECVPHEIDNYFMDENNVLEVYGIRFYQRQKNIIFHYENTVKVIHVSYIPKFETHNFIYLPDEEDESEEETVDDSSEEDESDDSENESSEEENESSEEENESSEEDESEEETKDGDVEVCNISNRIISPIENDNNGEIEQTENKRERTESEKQIENEVSEFTSIN